MFAVKSARSRIVGTSLRHASTTRKSERPPYHPPDPFVDNPTAVVKTLENLTFIHRPPPTAPTPFSFTTAPASPLLKPPAQDALPQMPPAIRPSAEKDVQPERLSDEKLAELRRLRRQDPRTYSRGKLAKMFGCTQGFVAKVAALPKTQRAALIRKENEKHEEIRSKWSEKKAVSRAIRVKRREFW